MVLLPAMIVSIPLWFNYKSLKRQKNNAWLQAFTSANIQYFLGKSCRSPIIVFYREIDNFYMLLGIKMSKNKNNALFSYSFFKRALSTTICQRKMSVDARSFPTISFSSHFSFLLMNRIKLSHSSSIISCALNFNSFNFTSVISPSNTEFWIQFRYFRHSLSIFDTRFSPTS